MTKIICLLTILIFIIASCKVTEKDIAGSYQLDRFPKTTLIIDTDKTFEFSKNNPNPYLHPFDHPDQFFSVTKGSWKTIGKKIISLTSQMDTVIYPLVTIQATQARNNEWSYFTFYDTFGDTVKVLYVQFTDSSISAAMHRSMDYYTEDISKRDTLEFHFYGYRPYTFISGKKINQDYAITLKPAFQPNFFIETEFKVKRNQLVDIKRKGRFRMSKIGI